MTKFVAQVYKAFVDTDATLLEINPVLINGYGEIVAVDCKASMDENALYRHKDIEAMHDPNEDDATELEAKNSVSTTSTWMVMLAVWSMVPDWQWRPWTSSNCPVVHQPTSSM